MLVSYESILREAFFVAFCTALQYSLYTELSIVKTYDHYLLFTVIEPESYESEFLACESCL